MMNRKLSFRKNAKLIKVVGIFIILSLTLNGCRYRAPVAGGKISVTLRSYIAAHDKEQTGYGGYSYILLKNRPAPEENARYKALLRTFVNCLRLDTTYTSRYPVARSEVNITYWLLADYMQVRNVTKFENDTVNSQYFIDNFDYVRSLKIMNNIEKFPMTEGPFIICSRSSLTTYDERVQCKDLLIFDLTNISDYKGFQKVIGIFEHKVKRDAQFAKGCVYAEKVGLLQDLFSTEAPEIKVDLGGIAMALLKGVSP